MIFLLICTCLLLRMFGLTRKINQKLLTALIVNSNSYFVIFRWGVCSFETLECPAVFFSKITKTCTLNTVTMGTVELNNFYSMWNTLTHISGSLDFFGVLTEYSKFGPAKGKTKVICVANFFQSVTNCFGVQPLATKAILRMPPLLLQKLARLLPNKTQYSLWIQRAFENDFNNFEGTYVIKPVKSNIDHHFGNWDKIRETIISGERSENENLIFFPLFYVR